MISAGATVVDVVSFKDLSCSGASYTLTAKLINKADESVIGTGTVNFTPDSANGEQKVLITVSEGVTTPVASAVAFERLTSNEVDKQGNPITDGSTEVIATHEDINDQNQTVTGEVPEETTSETTTPEETTSETTPEETTSETPTESSTVPEQPEVPASPDLNPEIATQARLDGNVISAGATVVDVVSFKDLPGASYTLTAKLINKADESVIGTGTVNFTPDSANGEQKVLITVSEGVTTPVASAVAFERLTSNEVDKQGNPITDGSTEVIATHEDINDQNQTVTGEVPEETTSETTTPEETTSETTPEETTSETTPEETTSETTPEETTSETTPEETTSETTPEETTSETTPEETTSETPTESSTVPEQPEVPASPDLNPEIATQARLNGTEIVSGGTVIDTVSFKDLVPGATYTLNAKLINKADESVIGSGSYTFTPAAASGEVQVPITIDSSVTDSVASAVAFERLTSNEVDKQGNPITDGSTELIATHEDINDQNQTVNSTKPVVPEPTTEPSSPRRPPLRPLLRKSPPLRPLRVSPLSRPPLRRVHL